VKTHIGFGSPRKQDTFEVHGSPLGPEEVTATKKNLGWPTEPKFFIPEEVRAHFQGMAAQGKKLEEEWKRNLETYGKTYPGLAQKWTQWMNLELPGGWEKDIPVFPPDPKGMATRAAGGKILNSLAPHVPFLIGGSADLNPSTNTVLKGRGNFQPPRAEESPVQGAEPGPWSYSGANIHFGVREHAMGSILNGMAVHGGVLPFGSTFLVFSDYMRPAIRLAALMKLRVIYVFTHDSVALGEDGPTHQPVEHTAALRAIPGLTVIRPADANEASQAWKVAIQNKEGPVALLMTRQAVPIIDRTRFSPAEGLKQGAYILADSPSGRPEVILMATGSEVAPALAAFQRLGEEAISARLVSMPSWELFEKQPEEYKNRVLPQETFTRVSMEAGVTQGWHKYVGPGGEAIGIDHFGASAPVKVLLEKFGITAENIMSRAKALLALRAQK
jgi:transketolase